MDGIITVLYTAYKLQIWEIIKVLQTEIVPHMGSKTISSVMLFVLFFFLPTQAPINIFLVMNAPNSKFSPTNFEIMTKTQIFLSFYYNPEVAYP